MGKDAMQGYTSAVAGWKCALAGAALLLLVAGVYWPGLTGPFLFDDFPTLVSNARVHVAAGDWAGLWRAATSFDPGGTGRQLAMASFGLNHMLAGLDPWGWKLGGLLVHLFNALLIYLLCQRLLVLAGVQLYVRASAAALALAWAVHPLQVSTVLYVVQRMETLCLTFILLALLAYLRGRAAQIAGNPGWGWIAACVPLLLLALGAKESALLLPLFTLALELTVLGFAAASARTQRFWRGGYALGVVLGLVIYVAVVIPHYANMQPYIGRDFSMIERVLSQLRILPMYLGQIVLPLPGSMSFYYDDFVPSVSLLQPWTTLAGGIFLAGLLGVACWRRSRYPLAALGVFWFIAAHAMTSNVVPLELVFEHRNYFALLGVLLVLAEGVRRLPVRDGPGIKVVAVALVIVFLGFIGFVRASVWGNNLLLTTELTYLNPDSGRAAHDMGILYHAMSDGSIDSPFFSFAVRELEREASLPNASILGEQSLILIHAEHGLDVQAAWWTSLHARLRDRPVGHETVSAMFGLLHRRMAGVVMDDAALGDAFLIMFDRKPMPAYSYGLVARHALLFRKDEALAKAILARVLAAEDVPGYLDDLESVLRDDGHPELAMWLKDQRG
jgi:hypothetical protein